VAINQAGWGGEEKSWYTSTLELQLASLEFCRACRNVSTLLVHVDAATPRSLWAPDAGHSAQQESPTSNVLSRVPSVRALGVSWSRCSVDHLQQMSTPKFLSFGQSFSEPITEVGLPASLLQLSFGECFNQPVLGVAWPPCLVQLSFGVKFNQPIVGVVWPDSLQQLSFRDDFNQPLVGVVWPSSLQKLSFGTCFNEPIVGVVWPASLQQLSLGMKFNQPILGVVWPSSLQFFGRLPCSSSRSVPGSTSLSWRFCGLPAFSSCLSE